MINSIFNQDFIDYIKLLNKYDVEYICWLGELQ